MKIYLGENEYLSASITDDGFMSISIKAKKSRDSYVMISSKIGLEDLDSFISFLIANKSKLHRSV